MGINKNGLRFLLYAKSTGVDFARTAMIGRQGLHLSFGEFCSVITKEFGIRMEPRALAGLYEGRHSEGLLAYLGAETVHSYDVSGAEGPTHVHDFNHPITNESLSRYTVVIDGGSLEHVFNFPVAIKNCMEMIEPGGHYLGISPSNNWMGHGFYQFSPEIYFRVLSRSNGFEIEKLLCHQGRRSKNWFEVPDSAVVHRRVGIRGGPPILLLIVAKRVEDRAIFSTPPIQADTFAIPDVVKSGSPSGPPRKAGSLLQRLVRPLRKLMGRGDVPPLYTRFDFLADIDRTPAGLEKP